MRIKIKRSHVIFAVGVVLGLALVAYFFAPPFLFGCKQIKDVSYIEGDNSLSHKLDLYVPAHKKLFENPRPLIVFIHGGAWQRGDKADGVGRLVPLFGYVGASINYRFSQEAPFPAQIEDCRAAIAYLRRHCDEYGIDPKRIGVWGLSTGGHLALLLGLAPEHNFKPGTTIKGENDIQAVFDWAGPTDLLTIAKQCKSGNDLKSDSPEGAIAKLLGGLPEQQVPKARDASPVTFVDKEDTVPIYIMHGELDDIVPKEQSEELASLLEKYSVPHQLRIVAGVKHDLKDPNLIRDAIQFFDKELKPGR